MQLLLLLWQTRLHTWSRAAGAKSRFWTAVCMWPVGCQAAGGGPWQTSVMLSNADGWCGRPADCGGIHCDCARECCCPPAQPAFQARLCLSLCCCPANHAHENDHESFPWLARRLNLLLAALQIVDEFMTAVSARWPHAVIQFEDFQLKHAHPLLQRYRHHHLMWNDDIQVR